MKKSLFLTLPFLLTLSGCNSNISVHYPPETATTTNQTITTSTSPEMWITINSPEMIDNLPTTSTDLPLTFAFPESYIPYVEFQTYAQGSGYDIKILKGEKGKLRIYDAVLEPPATGFSGEEFDDVPTSTRADVIDRAFPKETIKKNFGSKQYILEFYYRQNDAKTKDELHKIADTLKLATQNN